MIIFAMYSKMVLTKKLGAIEEVNRLQKNEINTVKSFTVTIYCALN